MKVNFLYNIQNDSSLFQNFSTTFTISQAAVHLFINQIVQLHLQFHKLVESIVFSYPNMGLFIHDLHTFYQHVIFQQGNEEMMDNNVNNNDLDSMTSLLNLDPTKYLKAMPKMQHTIRNLSLVNTDGSFITKSTTKQSVSNNNTTNNNNDQQVVNKWFATEHSHMFGVFSKTITQCLTPLSSQYSQLHAHLHLYNHIYYIKYNSNT